MPRVFTSQDMRDFKDFQPGDKFVGCNFGSVTPHTPLAPGVSGLIFESCNLTNRDLPADATTPKSLRAQMVFPPPAAPKPLTPEEAKEREALGLEAQAVQKEAEASSLRAQAADVRKAVAVKEDI